MDVKERRTEAVAVVPLASVTVHSATPVSVVKDAYPVKAVVALVEAVAVAVPEVMAQE